MSRKRLYITVSLCARSAASLCALWLVGAVEFVWSALIISCALSFICSLSLTHDYSW